MKSRWVLGLITAILLGLGVLIFFWPNFMIAPGPLAPAHATLAKNCFACHEPFQGAAAEQCVSCHVVATIGLLTTKGVKLPPSAANVAFHQKLTNQNCLSCHTGHAGSVQALGHRPPFSHELLLPEARAKCDTCHKVPGTPIHRGASANCGLCHGQDGWKPTHFDHTKFFLLEGPHRTACATCFGCHEHQPDAIRARHLREGISNFENCVQCHRSGGGEHGEGSSGERGDDD